MNFFYMQRGKEEILVAKDLFKKLSDVTAPKMLGHLIKSMDFIVDFLNDKHVDLSFDLT